MGDFNVVSGQRIEAAGVVSATSTGTVVTAGSANVKGSYAELIASTSFHAKGILLHFGGANTNHLNFLIDIAVGASASEQNIVENFFWYGSRRNNANESVWLPIEIPQGSRVSIRIQCSTASQAAVAVIYLIGYSMVGGAEFQRATSYGAETSSSSGAQVDAGPTVNTKGAWTELDASTARDIRWMMISIGDHDASMADNEYLLDIGVGAASSEQVVVPDLLLAGEASPDILQPSFIGLPMHIPAGTRLSARAQADTTSATKRVFDVTVLGFN